MPVIFAQAGDQSTGEPRNVKSSQEMINIYQHRWNQNVGVHMNGGTQKSSAWAIEGGETENRKKMEKATDDI